MVKFAAVYVQTVPMLVFLKCHRAAVRTILFALPVVLLAVGAEWGLRRMPNMYRPKEAAMRTVADSVETLVLGASHTLMGIRPDSLGTRGFNMAGVSQTSDIDAMLLDALLPKMPRLHNVVVGADAAILADPPLCEGSESFRCTYYNLYTHLGGQRIGTWPRFAFLIADWEGVKLQLAALRYKRTDPETDRNGWYCGYTLERKALDATSPDACSKRAAQHLTYGRGHVADNRAALRRIYRTCHENGLRFVLINTPVHTLYRQALAGWLQDSVAATLDEFRNMPGTLVLDFSAAPQFCEQDFFDPDHLATTGAAKLSRLLREEYRL